MSCQNASIGRQLGVTGVQTRTVLEALREPATVAVLMEELQLPRSTVWENIKHLHEQGRVQRLARGVYQISAAGCEALNAKPEPALQVLPGSVRRPPAGHCWTPERVAWLQKFYPKLGHRRCGELLGVNAAATWARASQLSLSFGGEIPGYILLTELASLLEAGYVELYARAKRAGVLTFPTSVMGNKLRRKALVPDSWAEQIANERQPSGPDDVLLVNLRAELGLSKTQIVREAGSAAYLRTPVSGGQARLCVSWEKAEEIRQRRREKAKQPKAPVIGRAGVLAAITVRGAEGATERELYESLRCSTTAVRVHVLALLKEGWLERCRAGEARDPFVYRLVEFIGQPMPQQRFVPRGGRPRKVQLGQAAD